MILYGTYNMGHMIWLISEIALALGMAGIYAA